MGLFLCLQGNTYHFRKAVPSSLRSYLNKREIKKSLQTGNKLEARSRSLVLGTKVDKAITQARAVAMNNQLSEAEKEEIIKGFFHFLFKVQESHLDSAISGFSSYLDLDFPAHRKAAKAMGIDVQPEVDRLKNFEKLSLDRSLEEHKNRDFESLKDMVQYSVTYKKLLQGHKYVAYAIPDEALNGSFLNSLSLTRLEAQNIIYARRQGENPPIPERYTIINQNDVSPEAHKGFNKESSVPLTQVIDEFTKDRLAVGKWTEKTQLENHALYQNFRSGFTSLDQSATKLRWTVSQAMPPFWGKPEGVPPLA